MQQLCELLKTGRISKNLTVKQVSDKLKIDKALISKFENGQRRPTKNQVISLSQLFGIHENASVLAWLTEKILSEIDGEDLGLKALKSAEAKLTSSEIPQQVDDQFNKLLREMESLKTMLGKKN
ncbi:helix-turn-helix transcriptional regulator [Flavobacterium sp.]|uniref:helix-turn-helix domain-containing protein n=1 Tax=Flavobacterium sp. TaxID=239 RepID=UPI0012049EF1|nr:helix-turn-helix transcriptional regulator [Flavobacterium sp.]RZJ70229.1 MAG: XRE family transcriptional regulator [Flavobacterium sp.]